MKKQRKWKSAEEKRRHMELAESWNNLKSKYKPTGVVRATKTNNVLSRYTPPAGRSTHRDIPSLDSGGPSVGARRDTPKYTGTAILGIGTLHKSNAVPVFSEEAAKEQASMRR